MGKLEMTSYSKVRDEYGEGMMNIVKLEMSTIMLKLNIVRWST